jgi:DNA-binding NarL/FixJ family response regulator
MPATRVSALAPVGDVHVRDQSLSTTLRIMLAHRHALVREGTRRIVEAQPGLEVIAETITLATAVPLIADLKPDLVVLGVSLEEINNRTYVRQLRSVAASTPVVILNEALPPHRLARLGINGWIDNTASPLELVAGIRAVADGKTVAGNPTLVGAFPERLSGHPTPRELEVLALVEQGLTTQAIAEQLRTSRRTVHFHVANLFTKLGANSRTEMVHLARRRGWLE